MFPFVLLLIALVGSALHLALGRQLRTRQRVIETILLYVLVCNVGLSGLIGFYGHAFLADEIAESIGWAKGSPFQFEIAVANLSYGFLGILCLWFRGVFWYATAIGLSVFLWGAAYGHIREIIVNANYAPNNAGAMLWADILIPVVLLGLLVSYKRAQGTKKAVQAHN
jgi:hypothetical protein